MKIINSLALIGILLALTISVYAKERSVPYPEGYRA